MKNKLQKKKAGVSPIEQASEKEIALSEQGVLFIEEGKTISPRSLPEGVMAVRDLDSEVVPTYAASFSSDDDNGDDDDPLAAILNAGSRKNVVGEELSDIPLPAYDPLKRIASLLQQEMIGKKISRASSPHLLDTIITSYFADPEDYHLLKNLPPAVSLPLPEKAALLLFKRILNEHALSASLPGIDSFASYLEQAGQSFADRLRSFAASSETVSSADRKGDTIQVVRLAGINLDGELNPVY